MLFKEVIGQFATKAKLIDMVKNNRISHAQLFLGQEGSGNFQLALAYAQYVNCVDKGDNDSCGKCHNCKKYSILEHPDLNFVFPNAITSEIKEKPESSKFYPQWRRFVLKKKYFNLQSWCEFLDIENKQPIINKLDSVLINNALILKSFEAEYKVIIVWWPEKMNSDCANKILKTLEEPTEKSLIILVGHQAEDLLPTILSRVQIINVESLSEEEIAQALMKEKNLDEQTAISIANLSDGSYQQALEMADEPDKNDYFIQQFQAWMRICYKLEVTLLTDWIDEISKSGREKQKLFLLYSMRMLRECIVQNYGSENLVKLHHLEEGFVQKFSPFIHGGNILNFIQEFNDAHYAISRNGSPKMVFMSLSLKICNFLRLKA